GLSARRLRHAASHGIRLEGQPLRHRGDTPQAREPADSEVRVPGCVTEVVGWGPRRLMPRGPLERANEPDIPLRGCGSESGQTHLRGYVGSMWGPSVAA